ncbi:MAG: adenylate/guanylate cyclase domain-containing protein [Spirochaetes bacterium]|nr:adenylate/guanylate cyclase domain-containing protein [Spirochaetota bacterium]
MAKITKLWRRKKFADYGSLFEMEYDREIMQSERARAFIVFIICCVIVLWFVIVRFFFARYFPAIALSEFYDYNIFSWLAFVFGGMALYELVYAVTLAIFLGKKKMFPFFPRFVNAAIEISVPSLIIYFTFKVFHSVQGLFTPIVFIFFIFIALSSLRLNFTLSLFTGMVAGIEYIMLSYFILWRVKYDSAYSSLYYPGMHISKGLLLVLVGFVTGLVSLQIKKRIKRAQKTTQEKNKIVNMFGQHVSPAVAGKLLEQKGELISETRYVCMMFLDIRNFTKFSESRNPAEVVSYLNTLFDFMIDCVNANRGIINKFLGDGFMAVFGAPVSDGEDCRNAVNAAYDIIARLEEEIRTGRIPDTKVGIGIHAGQAVTGNVGSSRRKEYTIIGDVVNLASRIEQLNKQYGSRILVSEEVWNAIEKNKNNIQDLGLVDIRGHSGSMHIYRLA